MGAPPARGSSARARSALLPLLALASVARGLVAPATYDPTHGRRPVACGAGRMPSPSSPSRTMPEEVTAEMQRALEALEAAGALVAAEDAAGAARLLTARSGDLLACDGETLSALCGDDGATRELVGAVLEAVAEEAAAVEALRRDLLQHFTATAKNSSAALDAAVAAAAEDLVDSAFVDFLDGEVARVVAAEKPSQELIDFLRALRERVANELEKAVFGAGAEALKRVLAIADDDLRKIAFLQALDEPFKLELLATLEATRSDLRQRGDDAPRDVVAALNALANVAADQPIDV